jgi:UDPglucose--hexose-1-phosphate uridylyltransferase
MGELRWNPLLKTWTMVSASRQKRPNLPDNWCPFCPGDNKKLPPDYQVLKYDNDFPILTPTPSKPDIASSPLYKSAENYGKAEVILFSPNHTETFDKMSVPHIIKVINLWIDRFTELSSDKRIKYVFIFENHGEEVGATISHPHGQIYAFPYIPQKIDTELQNSREYFTENNECLICAITREETAFKKRVVYENENFIAYIPFFTDYPYGVFVSPKKHIGIINGFDSNHKRDLADMIKNITGAFETLFEKPFPYMMSFHQLPVNSETICPDAEKYYHFHIEFYPPLRSRDKIKFYASSEMGAWAAANPLCVEDTAIELSKALQKFKSKTEVSDD